MKNFIRLFFGLLIANLFQHSLSQCDNKGLKNICYYSSWVGVMPDPQLCTTVIYSFADMSGGVLSGVWGNPLSQLRQANPNIKILLAVGGWNFGVTRMTEMLSTEASRQRFAEHSVSYLRNLDFDGLDLDYEYPGTNYPEYGRYSPPEDKQRFTQLCQQLRDTYEAEGARNPSKERLMITVAFGCRQEDIDLGYEVDKLADSLDYFHLMTYDLRGGFDSIASHHSALYAGDYEKGHDRVYNIDWVINYFIEKGAPPEKLILGLASYGKSFRWHSPPYELGAPATFADWHSYSDVCAKLRSGWTRKWIGEQEIPVAVSGNVVIGYDDVQSVKIKAEYAIEKGLGGVMWWALDHDDSWGSCGEGRFPLINAAKNVFQTSTTCSSTSSSGDGSTTTRRTTTTTPTVSTASTTGTTTSAYVTTGITAYDCTSGKEFVKHPDDCKKYIKCSDKSVGQCMSGLVFDYDLQICNWPYNVKCEVLASTAASTTTPASTTQTTTIPSTTDSAAASITTVPTPGSTTPATATSTIASTTTAAPTTTFNALSGIYGYDCSSGKEFVKHPEDCRKFIKCSDKSVGQCIADLVFDYDFQICNWPSNVKCEVLTISTTSTSPTVTTTESITCEDGIYPDPERCEQYITCYNNEVSTTICRKLAGLQLIFDEERKVCDLPSRTKPISTCV